MAVLAIGIPLSEVAEFEVTLTPLEQGYASSLVVKIGRTIIGMEQKIISTSDEKPNFFGLMTIFGNWAGSHNEYASQHKDSPQINVSLCDNSLWKGATKPKTLQEFANSIQSNRRREHGRIYRV